MRPCPEPRAERAAYEGRDDANVLGRNAEDRCDLIRGVVHPLGLVPESETLALPDRDGRVHLDWVVVLARHHIGRLNLDLGAPERCFSIAAPSLWRSCLSLIGFLLSRQKRLDTLNVAG